MRTYYLIINNSYNGFENPVVIKAKDNKEALQKLIDYFNQDEDEPIFKNPEDIKDWAKDDDSNFILFDQEGNILTAYSLKTLQL